MKANAPEKIYLFENPISGTPDDRWLSKRSDENDIEYTRADVFIEKVYTWLKNYAFVDDNKSVNLPVLLHDFLKDLRKF